MSHHLKKSACAGNKSDVDILVELSVTTFDNYMDLKFFLEDQLGLPIDLVLADFLKPRLRPIITREVVYNEMAETIQAAV